MQILLIEDDAMQHGPLPRLNERGSPRPADPLQGAGDPAHLLRQQSFDVVICRQYHHQAREGVRLLQEAHYLGLEPGCVLLLLDEDHDQLQFPLPTSTFRCYCPCRSPPISSPPVCANWCS